MWNRHRWRNLIHSLLLLGSMMLLLSLLGQLLFGDSWLWVLALLAIVGLLLLPSGSPAILMRLYRAVPLHPSQAPDLYRLTGMLAQRAQLEAVPRLYLIPSATQNAFTSGHPSQAAIGLTDGLLRNLNQRELAGVLAHEMAHLKNRDLFLMHIADAMAQLTFVLALLGGLLLLLNLPLVLLGVTTISWLAIVILLASPLLSNLLQMALSRTREFDADACAVAITGDPQGLASALYRLEPRIHPWLARLGWGVETDSSPSMLRSHPPTAERIQRLQEMSPQRGASLAPHTRHAPPHPVRIRVQPPRRHWNGFWY